MLVQVRFFGYLLVKDVLVRPKVFWEFPRGSKRLAGGE